MTQAIISISNAAAKFLKQKFERFETAPGEQLGLKLLVTNSVQVSWQVHTIQLKDSQFFPCDDGSYVFFFIEAYSRYTLVKSYALPPSWQVVYEDFLELWFTHVFKQLMIEGIIHKEQQAEAVTLQFAQATDPQQNPPLCYSNYDLSLGGIISDQVAWLQAFIEGKNLRRFNECDAEDFTDYINQIGRRIRDKNSKAKKEIHPEVRFITDSAYRFARGLCSDKTGECLGDNYPNPHQHKVSLRVVK